MKELLIRLCLTCALLLTAVPPAALAAGEDDGVCGQISLNLWGLSYHPDRTKGYNEQNWGAGFSCYTHPDIPWLLGTGSDNRLVFEGDGMLNSWRGLMVDRKSTRLN